MTLVDSQGVQPSTSLSTLFAFLIEGDFRERPFLESYQELYYCTSNKEEHPHTCEDNLCNNNRHTRQHCVQEAPHWRVHLTNCFKRVGLVHGEVKPRDGDAIKEVVPYQTQRSWQEGSNTWCVCVIVCVCVVCVFV